MAAQVQTPELGGGARSRILRRSIAATVLGGALYWIADSFVDARFFSRETVAHALLHPSAEEVYVRITFTVAMFVFLVLLLARRESETRLRLFSQAVEEAAEGIQLADMSGRVVYSNPAVRSIYGFSPEEYRGRHVNEMNADPTFAERVILPAVQSTGTWTGELEVKHKDGHVFPIWLLASLVKDPRGRPIAMFGAIRDITERKRHEEEQRRYAKMLEEAVKVRDLFTDILRHDLINPAGVVRTTLEALLHRDQEPGSRRLLETALSAARRIVDMTETASEYARLSSLEELALEPLDLGEHWATALRDLAPQAEARRMQIRYLPRGPLLAEANPVIGDVFSNLLSNAIKYGPEGGQVEIDISAEGESWRISVKDRGEGIADEAKERVFGRFERLHKAGVKGSGLGLAIAKRIVELHRGRIWVEDNPGGGAVFLVSLPKRARR